MEVDEASNTNNQENHNLNPNDIASDLNVFTFGSNSIPTIEEQKIKYLMLSMRDQIDCDISLYLYAAIDFITAALEKNSRAKILVHCYKGNSRSVAVVAGYFMWKNGLTETEALDLIRSKRSFIDPNLGFVGQLMMFHKNFQRQKASL